ncbi:MAG: hypothetical protein ACUVR8_10385 [Acidobacteriota bacterium]
MTAATATSTEPWQSASVGYADTTGRSRHPELTQFPLSFTKYPLY